MLFGWPAAAGSAGSRFPPSPSGRRMENRGQEATRAIAPREGARRPTAGEGVPRGRGEARRTQEGMMVQANTLVL